MNKLDYKAREKFLERIKKGLLGPGSDTWGLPDEEEIISDYPLLRYFTGVLFPESTPVKSQFESDASEVKNETSDDIENEKTDSEKENDDSQLTKSFTSEIKGVDTDKISHNHFYPTNIGMTICVDNSTKELDVEFSFGIYYQPQPSLKEVKIKISEAGFKSFFDENIPYQLPFRNKLKYDGEFMYLDKELKGYAGGRGRERSGEYKSFDEFIRRDNLANSPAKFYVDKLEKLISRKWKRKEIKILKKIPIKNTQKPQSLELPFKSHKDLNVSYNVKTYDYKEKKYVKIQLANTSPPHPRNKFSNKNENLNSKCLFQAKIKVISDNILPYKEQSEHIPFDKESELLNLIYRNVKSYGIGHNCSVIWEGEKPTQIQTTFIPQVNVRSVKNTFDEVEKDLKLDEILNIKNLSTFGLEKKKVIQNLIYFVDLYANWIKGQKKQINDLEENDKNIAKGIIERQEENLNRLKNGLNLLNNNDIAFKAFQLANLAMYIQFIISNDKDFSKAEKELSEINDEVEYANLEFFRNYDFNRLGFVPKYRPFQLAFFLLSLDGIVNKQSKSRREIVDLIWFPTGGGKTEAYLAVTAFTIIWRRWTNEKNYDGTTVLMRYTLRLLTAQQFERASRLISTLEFLRNQGFKSVLRDDTVTIGLWIGQASTPNRLKDAKKKLDIIESECAKENGNPVDKNAFQISSCPWCGTKLISKDKNGNWHYGFKSSRNTFKIFCLNEECPFRSGIPVQIIDELLYKNPPTLLFGTVDKFAILSWQEEAYNFFNTHDDEKLPPDLIIQDELHLLNGPLGSVTGIFESVIELLCTKKGVPPKIIASTATTRNTNEQIKKLYGNREVNIFPPAGLNYNDSFFTKESNNETRRLYIGFMPTGKTSLDTQLQLLAHLLIARLEIYSDKELRNAVDNYWTIVSYYNTLKDVGKIFNKVGDEITTFTKYLQNRLSSIFQGNFDQYKFNYMGIKSRTRELTSRWESERIKVVLKELEEELTPKKIVQDEKGRIYLNNVVDLVLATNMISVGIDVSRLNVILINGMPKNVAEYIQASSRIGRKTYGLVMTLFDPNRAREKSYFEHFKSFHQSYYKNVEPLSVTPFTENTINKMLSSLLVTFVRQYYPGELNRNDQAQYFNKEKIIPLIKFIKERFSDQSEEIAFFENEINRIADDWMKRIKINNLKKYNELLKKPAERTSEDDEWIVMQSMREIDTNTFIQIKGVK